MSKLISSTLCIVGVSLTTVLTWYNLSNAYVDDLERRLKLNNKNTVHIIKWRQESAFKKMLSVKDLKDLQKHKEKY